MMAQRRLALTVPGPWVLYAALVHALAARARAHLASQQPSTVVTPAPCSGDNPSACPYYWHPAKDTFYRVFVNGVHSFVYQGENPPKCSGGYKAQPGHCASHWNVQSQSYTMASVARLCPLCI